MSNNNSISTDLFELLYNIYNHTGLPIVSVDTDHNIYTSKETDLGKLLMKCLSSPLCEAHIVKDSGDLIILLSDTDFIISGAYDGRPETLKALETATTWDNLIYPIGNALTQEANPYKTIYCLIGSSGSGKSTVANEMTKQGCPEIISHTTRVPRNGEIPDKSYHFTTKEDFNKKQWIERTTYCDNFYGSSVEEVLTKLASNKHVCTVVTYEGYEHFKKYFKYWNNIKVIGVYVDGGDKETLKQRISDRMDKPDDIESRLNKYETEQQEFKDKVFDIIFDNTKAIDLIPANVTTIFNQNDNV